MKLLKKQNGMVANYRCAVLKLQEEMCKLPGVMIGDCCPLKHTFVGGMYIRQITMPAGMLIVSKIHKYEHPYFILSGKVSVYTEDGLQQIKAPFSGITKAGTKRALLIHEETVWVTIHKTNETDVDSVEKEIIAKDFSEIGNDIIGTTCRKEIGGI